MSQTGRQATGTRQPAGSVNAARLRIYLIAAVASNGVIGAGGGLPWHLPEDLKRFKCLTVGHPVIMGRRTWETLGRALPARENIVVTRRADYDAPGAAVAGSLAAALALCAGLPVAFVIGGEELYRAALPVADVLLLTEIERDYEGDARFPTFDRDAWRETQRTRHVGANGMRFDFARYERAA
jgi:dihydrofolate reductase